MTVTCALDVFSCLDGCGSVSRGWGGCWGKQGPELVTAAPMRACPAG